MFDKVKFDTVLGEVIKLLMQLSDLTERNFGTIGLAVKMDSRGIPKDFVNKITDARNKANISNHAALRFDKALHVDLPQAVRSLRREYVKSSGGTELRLWRNSRLLFVIANGGGEPSVSWALSHFRPKNVAWGPLTPGSNAKIQLVERLDAHARLDLTGPTKKYLISLSGNSTFHFEIHAPTPELALARFSIINGKQPREILSIHEVFDVEDVRKSSQAHIPKDMI